MYGYNEAVTGYAVAVLGESYDSANGHGVCGKAGGTNGRGVFDEVTGAQGYGVFGLAVGGTGVYGESLTGDGVSGFTESPTAAAVVGYNDAETGNAIAIKGISGSSTGFGGYFEGRGYFSGDVGIGRPAPSEKLDVAGTVMMLGLRLGMSATPGQVLTADGNGVGTWQTPPGLWQPSGSDVYYDAGNVGIGTATPYT